MKGNWEYFLWMIVAALCVQSFYAMAEMATVSLNKVRLQYYVSKKSRRAKWLSYLINHPTQLFGTTLICINAALQFGSESARHFYLSLGLSPSWAAVSQVIIVLIFAEIAPMLAGRRYSESAALLSAPILYGSSLLLRPIIWCFDLLCRFSNWLIRSPGHPGLYLSREELQKILEEREMGEFDVVVAHIFALKTKTARELMQPMSNVRTLSSLATIGEMRSLLATYDVPYLPITHKGPQNIVAIAYPRDLLRFPDNRKVREGGRPPWFITAETPVLQILKQFRRNNQSVAVVLNQSGMALGILTLDEIIDEIFGQSDQWMSFEDSMPPSHPIIVERTFPGSTLVSDFNREFHAYLDGDEEETLGELVTKTLGHHPAKGESVRIDQFEFTVEEPSLLGARAISVRTL